MDPLNAAIRLIGEELDALNETIKRNQEKQIQHIKSIDETLKWAFAEQVRENNLKEKARRKAIRDEFSHEQIKLNVDAGDCVTVEHDGEEDSFFVTYRHFSYHSDHGMEEGYQFLALVGDYQEIPTWSRDVKDLGKKIAEWFDPKTEMRLIDHHKAKENEKYKGQYTLQLSYKEGCANGKR